MYEAAFKNIDDTLRDDAGCSTELDYIEQTSWILFLKYLHDFEAEKEREAEVNAESYTRIIQGEFRWDKWAAPKKPDGKLDYNSAMNGEILLEFVNNKLFPHLAGFKQIAVENQRSITYKIGEIFSEVHNELKNPNILSDVIEIVDELHFLSDENKHELSSLYENKIKNMGNAGRNGGEYYTPRPLIKSIVKIINPKIGETVYDGAVGSAGFLCEAYAWMRGQGALSAADYEKLQNNTFSGKEKKSLPYLIGIMNMILHGIKEPNILPVNTLNKNINEIDQKDQVDVVLANPPFGGKERTEIQHNFNIKTGETAYLFLQHFIKMLKAGGRCGVVIKNTFLSNTDKASIDLREHLLEDCNLFAVLDLPNGVFFGSGVKTVVLFFDKGEATKKIWYYQLNLKRKLGKTDPLNENDLAEFVAMAKTQKASDNSWVVDVADINKETWDLTVKNPNRIEEVDNRTPKEIVAEIEKLDAQATKALHKIKELV